jgi:antitoxin HicB
MKDASHYTMVIHWSDEDSAYLVSLPEWHDRVINPVTHGESYEQAAIQGQKVLELLIESTLEHQQPLPEPEPVAITR